jgi:hypothetical protein
MKKVILPSGLSCIPLSLQDIYGNIETLSQYNEYYCIVKRLKKDTSIDEIWQLNPFIVSSVIPSDLAIYDPTIHKTVK